MTHSHFFMLACISIFTGMIAPTAGHIDATFPYAMTNMQYVAFLVFLSLSGLFLASNLHKKIIANILAGILIVMIISLFGMTMGGFVKNFSGNTLQYFSWGWVFLIIGLVFLVIPFVTEKDEDFTLPYQKILAYTGAGTLLFLAILVMLIAGNNAKKYATPTGMIKEIFSNKTENLAGAISTPAFENISLFEADRVKNSLSFIGTSSGESIWYPGKITLSAPDNIARIQTFGERTFITTKDGNVLENREYAGLSALDSDARENFVFYRDVNGMYQLVSANHKAHFMPEWDNISKTIFDEKTLDIYWRANVGNGQAIYKNNKKITEEYPGILRYAIGQNGAITLITEDYNHNKMVVKDGVVIHTIRDEYVRGTLHMNGGNVLYAVQNPDSSFSIIINGSTLDRELAEIREIFLEKNGSGFAYFGRLKDENTYCIFTRYKGNLCGFIAYMNPWHGADGSDVVFAGNRDGNWAIYKNSNKFASEIGYGGKIDISHDYFFFDPSNPRHFAFVEKDNNGYFFNIMWKKHEKIWKDVDVENVFFGYNNKIIVSGQDESGWRIAEIE